MIKNNNDNENYKNHNDNDNYKNNNKIIMIKC